MFKHVNEIIGYFLQVEAWLWLLVLLLGQEHSQIHGGELLSLYYLLFDDSSGLLYLDLAASYHVRIQHGEVAR